MDGMDFHGWHGSSMDHSIRLIAAILPPMGLPSMDGIFHPLTATLFIDSRYSILLLLPLLLLYNLISVPY